MTDTPVDGKRGIWLRALLMLLMAIAYQICGTVLAVAALVQFVLTLLGDGPNAQLIGFCKSLGLYLSQIAAFVTFAAEEAPFPFRPWP